MTGAININEDVGWSCQTPLCRGAIELIVETLQAQNQPVPEYLQIVYREKELNHVSFQDYSESEFVAVTNALITGIKGILINWPPDEIFGYVCLVIQLKAMMVVDPRYPPAIRTTTGCILLTDAVTWQAERWVYELIVENMIAWLREHQADTQAEQLLNQYDSGQCDLREQNIEQSVLPVIEFLHQHKGTYLKVRWWDGNREILAARVSELYTAFKEI